MSLKKTLDAFDEWRAKKRPMALITVYQTTGSTYSKSGHRMLISTADDHTIDMQGLISGGCLEGDLAEQALTVMQTGTPATITYDLRDDADDIWGLGIGCNGVIQVLIQALHDASHYEPFNSMAKIHRSVNGGCSAMLIDNNAGATLAMGSDVELNWNIPASLHADIRAHCDNLNSRSATELVRHANGAQILYAPLPALPRLLVLGAGPDAIPLVALATELGWLVTVTDHRDKYIEQVPANMVSEKLCTTAMDVSDQLTLDDFSAAVIMSHHFETDKTYLTRLASTSIEYIGLLGPIDRKKRLMQDLPVGDDAFLGRLHGPAGLDIGADSPETIALAILTEIEQIRRRKV